MTVGRGGGPIGWLPTRAHGSLVAWLRGGGAASSSSETADQSHDLEALVLVVLGSSSERARNIRMPMDEVRSARRSRMGGTSAVDFGQSGLVSRCAGAPHLGGSVHLGRAPRGATRARTGRAKDVSRQALVGPPRRGSVTKKAPSLRHDSRCWMTAGRASTCTCAPVCVCSADRPAHDARAHSAHRTWLSCRLRTLFFPGDGQHHPAVSETSTARQRPQPTEQSAKRARAHGVANLNV